MLVGWVTLLGLSGGSSAAPSAAAHSWRRRPERALSEPAEPTSTTSARRAERGRHACSFSRSVKATKVEGAVWKAVYSILTDPVGLRRDPQTMIEQQRQANVDPTEEATEF